MEDNELLFKADIAAAVDTVIVSSGVIIARSLVGWGLTAISAQIGHIMP